MIIDNSISGTYSDNFFAESYLIFQSSPNLNYKRRISSYDDQTGTFVLADSLPIDYDEELHSSSINYTVEASPAQRLKSGIDEPTSTDYLSSFSTANSREEAVYLSSINGTETLSPGDIFYIWVEREIGKSNSSYSDNNFVLSINFNKEFLRN
jgi:hypothetical protein